METPTSQTPADSAPSLPGAPALGPDDIAWWRQLVADLIELPPPAVLSAVTAHPAPNVDWLPDVKRRHAEAIVRAVAAGVTPKRYKVHVTTTGEESPRSAG